MWIQEDVKQLHGAAREKHLKNKYTHVAEMTSHNPSGFSCDPVEGPDP